MGQTVATEVAPWTPASEDVRAASRGRLVLRRLRRRPGAVLGAVGLAVLFLAAYLGPVVGPWRYDELDFLAFQEPPSARHWFGTTQTGGDVFALTMRGTQKSLVIGLSAALVATGLAALVGAFAGYLGGWLDRVLTAVGDLMLVMPAFLVIAILSPNLRGANWLIFVVLLGGFLWMVTARVVRGLTLSLKEREFVLAARFMGVPARRVVLRHILPNLASFLIVDFTINVGAAVIGEVGLSYFGFGVQPPDASLGTLLAAGTPAVLTYPWQFCFAAGVLVAIVLFVNAIGDGLRDALDPGAAR